MNLPDLGASLGGLYRAIGWFHACSRAPLRAESLMIRQRQVYLQFYSILFQQLKNFPLPPNELLPNMSEGLVTE
jgi:hypothetical protein